MSIVIASSLSVWGSESDAMNIHGASCTLEAEVLLCVYLKEEVYRE